MLHLATPTRAEWIEQALANIDTVLLDHAHCEKKAASTAINLIFRYAHIPDLQRPLSELAREELRHFELLLGLLEARGLPFHRLRPAPYAGRLLSAVRATEPHRLVDTLLACSLIEARSCERMRLLAEHLSEPDLARMYRGLLASEARHHTGYVELALAVAQDEATAVHARLEELARHEAEVLAELHPYPRIHS